MHFTAKSSPTSSGPSEPVPDPRTGTAPGTLPPVERSTAHHPRSPPPEAGAQTRSSPRVQGHEHLIQDLILIGALGIGAQWLAWALRVPAIGICCVGRL
jgi:hypothetical protein